MGIVIQHFLRGRSFQSFTKKTNFPAPFPDYPPPLVGRRFDCVFPREHFNRFTPLHTPTAWAPGCPCFSLAITPFYPLRRPPVLPPPLPSLLSCPRHTPCSEAFILFFVCQILPLQCCPGQPPSPTMTAPFFLQDTVVSEVPSPSASTYPACPCIVALIAGDKRFHWYPPYGESP